MAEEAGTGAAPPTRPDLAPGTRSGPRRRWVPAVAVLATILAVVLGGFFVAVALSGPAGPPLDVGGVVRIRPPAGWEVAGRGVFEGRWSLPGGTITDIPFVRVTRGSASLDVGVIAAFGGSAEDLARWYETEVLSGQLSQLSVSSAEEIRVPPSRRAVRFGYLGVNETSIEGEVVVLVSTGGTGVIFDAWAAQGALAASLDDITRMVETAEVDR